MVQMNRDASRPRITFCPSAYLATLAVFLDQVPSNSVRWHIEGSGAINLAAEPPLNEPPVLSNFLAALRAVFSGSSLDAVPAARKAQWLNRRPHKLRKHDSHARCMARAAKKIRKYKKPENNFFGLLSPGADGQD